MEGTMTDGEQRQYESALSKVSEMAAENARLKAENKKLREAIISKAVKDWSGNEIWTQ
jgi:regulator of replication initiation timing